MSEAVGVVSVSVSLGGSSSLSPVLHCQSVSGVTDKISQYHVPV